MNRFYTPVSFNNDLINSLFSTMNKESDGISSFIPSVNTREGDYAYHIEIDLPGISKDEINISNNNGIITVNGERKFSKETKKEDYYKLESTYGKFQRSFHLPKDVDAENIDARYSDGVLELVIPKSKKGETKTITIK